MSFEDYVNHIAQKIRLAAAIAVLRSKPENQSTLEFVEKLRTNIQSMDYDSDVTICSDDFNVGFDDVINDFEFESEAVTDISNIVVNNTNINNDNGIVTNNIIYNDNGLTYNGIVSDNPFVTENVTNKDNRHIDKQTNTTKQCSSEKSRNFAEYAILHELKEDNTRDKIDNLHVSNSQRDGIEDMDSDATYCESLPYTQINKTQNTLDETQIYSLNDFTPFYTHYSESQAQKIAIEAKLIHKNPILQSEGTFAYSQNGQRTESLNLSQDTYEINNIIPKSNTTVVTVNDDHKMAQMTNDNITQGATNCHDIYSNENTYNNVTNNVSNTHMEHVKNIHNFEIDTKIITDTSRHNINDSISNMTNTYMETQTNIHSKNINNIAKDKLSHVNNSENYTINMTYAQIGTPSNANFKNTQKAANDINYTIDTHLNFNTNAKYTHISPNSTNTHVETNTHKAANDTNNTIDTHTAPNMPNTHNANDTNTHIISNDDSNSQRDVIPFKVIEELNKVKTYLKKFDRRISCDGSDSGYRSDSQGRNSKNTLQISGPSLNQSAYSLLSYLITCSLTIRTNDITREVSRTLGSLIDKLHEEEQYPLFLENLLDTITALLNDILEENDCNDMLLSKDENVQRILLLNRSTHVQKYTIDKITDILETIDTEANEMTHTAKLENLCYIFHILEIILSKHKIEHNSQSQDSQEKVLKRSSITDIWRKKWNLTKEVVIENVEKKCPLTKCSQVLNKIIVNCMEGYSLISFVALKCFNLLQPK